MKVRILIACAVLLLAVPLVAQQVSVNYNHSTSFAQFHTYAWGSSNANPIQNSILAQVAQQDLEAAMSEKGPQKVLESQNPDLILTASGGEREQTNMRPIFDVVSRNCPPWTCRTLRLHLLALAYNFSGVSHLTTAAARSSDVRLL